MRILFFFLSLMFYNIAFGQVLTDSTSNYYVAISVGDAQLNINNNKGTYARSPSLPRISGEFGYALGSENLKKHFFVPSIGFSYQELTLRTINKSSRYYNDKLTFVDIQLQGLIHLGGPRFMIFGGPVYRIPAFSQFEIYTQSSDGSFKWLTLNSALKTGRSYVAPRFGMKIKFGSAQLALSFTTTKTNFLKYEGNTYLIDSLQFITVESILYIPLKLLK